MSGCVPCSKKSQPTGFAIPSTPRGGAQAEQRAGAASVPGALTTPAPVARNVPPTGSGQ